MQLVEFLPILVFVLVYYAFGIFYATAALMVMVTLQLGLLWYLKRPISGQLKFTFWISLIFGGLTLLLHDRTFIQWKPTIINWAMASALLISHFFAKQNLVQRVLGGQLKLPATAWARLNFGWVFGFLLAGALNLYVARNFSEAFWVNYKLFGGIAITLIYMLITLAYLGLGGYLSNTEVPETSKKADNPL
jgi:intracellular septation protein